MSMEKTLLGLLREPASGYDLKVAFDSSLRHFWAAELSQIYVTLQRMERAGLLRAKAEPSTKGPDRKVYSLTPAGRKKLKAWLTSEPEFGDERYAYLAQLFFMAELGDFDRTIEFIKALRRVRAGQLELFRRIENEILNGVGGSTDGFSDDEFYQYLTLRSGICTMTARVKWCDEVIERIKERATGRCRCDRKKGSRK